MQENLWDCFTCGARTCGGHLAWAYRRVELVAAQVRVRREAIGAEGDVQRGHGA